MSDQPESTSRHRWRLLKALLGYGLFFSCVIYAIQHFPGDPSTLEPLAFLLALLVTLFFYVVQWIQLVLLIRHHGNTPNWRWGLAFVGKRALLNIALPARIGTLALVVQLERRCGVPWHQYLTYSVFCALLSLAVSAVTLTGLLLGNMAGFSAGIALLAVALLLGRRRWTRLPYLYLSIPVTLLAVAAFMCIMLSFYFVLHALGYTLSWWEAFGYSVALNTLAQIAITPGNMGVREVVLALLAPYLALPSATAILASSLLIAVRALGGGLLVLILDQPWRAKHLDTIDLLKK